MKHKSTLLALLTVAAGLIGVQAAETDAALQGRIDSKLKEIQAWGAEPSIVQAVKAFNTSPPAEAKDMTQDKWKTLKVLDPAIRNLTKNAVAEALRAHKSDLMTEAFVSGADGTKVGFLSKTSSWSHKGKPKHDLPMEGKTWQGPVEVDESTGLQQLQVAVPVLDGDKPIGSLVVGLSVSKLKE